MMGGSDLTTKNYMNDLIHKVPGERMPVFIFLGKTAS
jgi:hypothetical protein